MIEQFINLTSAKDLKVKELYRVIRRLGTSDISQLKVETGFKHGTVVRLLDELIANNMIDDSAVGASSGGRKPKVYQINPNLRYLIGVEISHLFAKVVLLDLNLDVKSLRRLRIDAYSEPWVVMDFIKMAISNMCQEKEIPEEKLLGIGVGVLASVDREQNSLYNGGVFDDLGWLNYNIAVNLEERTGLKVMVDSSLNLAALGEYRANFWNNYNRLVYVSSDLLMRSATIFNGGLLYSTSNEVDSFGHTIVEMNGRPCSCGAYGCLGQYSSLPVVFDEIIKQIKMGEPSSITEFVDSAEDLNYFDMIAGIEAGDPLCVKVTEEAALYFGIGLSNLILHLHPEVVIVGGTIGLRMFDKVKEIIESRISREETKAEVLIQAVDQEFNTVCQGAGCLIFDTFVEEKVYI